MFLQATDFSLYLWSVTGRTVGDGPSVSDMMDMMDMYSDSSCLFFCDLDET